MKKRLTLIVLMAVMTISAIATPRTQQQALAAAQKLAQNLGIEYTSMSPARTPSKTTQQSTTENYYVFNYPKESGFAIISGDDCMPEVIGYSTKGFFDTNNIPDGLKEFLEVYEATLTAVANGDEEALNIIQQRELRKSKGTQPILPLIQTKWNQGYPYNAFCPQLENDEHAATGCVATAMAQIINYHQSSDRYDWANMLPDYSSGYNSSQATAVANLMAHCGQSVNMQYGQESSATDVAAFQALTQNFNMDADIISYVYRRCFSFDEWVNLIDNELQNQRPIYYSGQNTLGSGHAFICDGRDTEGNYHINWGWGGLSDGFFDITILRANEQGTGGSSGNFGYNLDNSMIIGIQKNNGITDAPLLMPKFTLYNQPTVSFTKTTRTDANKAFAGSVEVNLGNINNLELNHTFALAIKNEDGDFTIISDTKTVNLPSMIGNRYYVTTFELLFNYAIPTSATQLFIVESSDNGRTWTTPNNAALYPIEIKVTETNLSIPTYPNGTIEVSEVVSSLKRGITSPIKISIKNNSSIETNKIIYVRIADTEELDNYINYGENLFFRGNETKTIEVNYGSKEAGTKYLFIFDNNRKILYNSAITISDVEDANLTITSMKINNQNGTHVSTVGNYGDLIIPKIDSKVIEFVYTFHNAGGETEIQVQPFYSTDAQKYSYTSSDIKQFRIAGYTDTEITISKEIEPGTVIALYPVILSSTPVTINTKSIIYVNGTLYYYTFDNGIQIAYLTLPGDIDDDSKLTKADVEGIANYILTNTDSKYSYPADANGNGKVTIEDINHVINAINSK